MAPALYLLHIRDSEKRTIIFLILISIFKTKTRASDVWINSETHHTGLD